MDFLDFLFFIAMFLLMNRLMSKAFEKDIEKKATDCPPHKWVYELQPGTDIEYMICKSCRAFPGSTLKGTDV